MPSPDRTRASIARWACRCALALLFIALACGTRPAHAHKASDAYLQLRATADTVELRWDIALRDLDAVLDLDRNGDRKLTWGEVQSRMDDIRAYALPRLRLQQGRCAMAEASAPAVEDRIDGAYLVFEFKARCDIAAGLDIDYRLLREVDPTHRGLLRIEQRESHDPILRSLDPAAGPITVDWPRTSPGDARGAVASNSLPANTSLFQDGIHHILIGYDHILFLLCLLLPAVLRRRQGGWKPVVTWREAVWPMLGIVTMFTVAHSLTLALAGLKLVTISPRVVEPAIAVTIMLAAVDNIYPLLRGRRKLFSFLFGLIHGFGFAGALAELELPVRGFVVALLQFNLGVEAGQLVVVFAALGTLLAVRRWRCYQPLLLQGGSVAAMLLASIWFFERVLDVQVLPFS
ncbi:HupE/UreJ family protein [Variovorax sp. J22R133]|uniref:HupE/UreJ family protein n=1 Tax=Variovorax brevis TaxID=3053503 RepID=UPI0025787CEF|nr:HupE/UreJ family protein [Variovorax sp. J22R133]MDM0112010.1 HupE/UreJ family protein [Variovorax sp. J22R133]